MKFTRIHFECKLNYYLTSTERTTLKKNNGSVSSPGYPQNYNDDVIQSVYIEAERGHVIALKFQTFVTENVDENGRKTDFVRVSFNQIFKRFWFVTTVKLKSNFYLISSTRYYAEACNERLDKLRDSAPGRYSSTPIVMRLATERETILQLN